ncbi:SDR family NAD(P)-dependent oxidoreductase [Nocardioides sp. L-11A]|uniref:SDR family NAD(P)-dependent oxidoreductase n=1 Tax=Nocardioides sp. L-11A TaxID=3043848 RepID=UPI00249AF962|nr:SDR family oxidoreductase [Nocardioides sp. L-11A]
MTTEPNPSLSLLGKVALVTGGSRGLGRAMVRGLAEAGADVVITSRKLEDCRALATEIEQDHGRRALPLALHVGHWDEIDAVVETVYAELGRIDVLINNAGLAPTYPSLDQVSEELFDKVVGVNLKGPFRLSALVAARMARGDGGSIINISSSAAVRPMTSDLPYAAAKGGLNVLTAGFAQAYGPKVRVNTIMAGPFLTDMARGWDLDALAGDLAHYPMRRAGDPAEVVGAALYFASDASSYTTGAVLPVDGGRGVVSFGSA